MHTFNAARNPVASRARCLGAPSRTVVVRRVCRASAKQTATLPIFPLNLVALPCATVPLMIFEARYRVLFNTLLDGSPGIEQGLVQTDAPWCGSRRFGMCYMGKEGRMASVGTVLEIMEHTNVPDGRLFVTNKGQERFKVVGVVHSKPVMVCKVEYLEDEEDTEEAADLAAEVADLLRSTIKLNVKMQSVTVSEDQLEPEELAELGPRDLSFFVASFFADIKLLQQNLLEEDSTVRRLQKEKNVLSETVSYFSAAAAIKSAFASPAGTSRASVEGSGGAKDRAEDKE